MFFLSLGEGRVSCRKRIVLWLSWEEGRTVCLIDHSASPEQIRSAIVMLLSPPCS